MRKVFAVAALLALSAVAMLAVAAPAMATTTDSCFDPATFGRVPAACQTDTVEHGVNVAVATVGAHSSGWFSLVCARGDDVVVRRGRLAVGGRRIITMDRLGLFNPACYLSVVAIADSPNHNARGSVALFSVPWSPFSRR